MSALLFLCGELTDIPAQYVLIGHPPGGTIGTTEPPPRILFGQKRPQSRLRRDADRALKKSVPVTLRVFDVLGRRVATLVNSPQPADEHQITWDGTDAQGRPVSSGVYFYRLQAGSYSKTRKMAVVR